MADLKALGITNIQGINNAATYRSDPGLEVFFQDQPMMLARYPNTDYMRIASVPDADGSLKTGGVTTTDGKFVCDDPRPARWGDEKDVWLHGFWRRDWCDIRVPLAGVDLLARTIRLRLPSGRPMSLRTGQWFYAENVLAELDIPGEWYLDRDTAILYFWPTAPLSSGKVVVSVVRDLFRLDHVSHVTFRGLSIEAGRGSAVVVIYIPFHSSADALKCPVRSCFSLQKARRYTAAALTCPVRSGFIPKISRRRSDKGKCPWHNTALGNRRVAVSRRRGQPTGFIH